jgi:signal transduction histidine kinase
VLKKEYHYHPLLQINPLLAEILFSNLIQNATRYNFENGVIEIQLTSNYFSIANSGHSLDGNEQKLFKRFAKFNPAAESLGLGLAIVKQVCDYYDFAILYSRENNLHCFTVYFTPSE